MSRDIPGFYYDEQKGKYFRIQPNHLVVKTTSSQNDGSETGYSNEAVKVKRATRDEQSEKLSWQQKQQRQTIKRSQVLSPSTNHDGTDAIVLNRRLGEGKRSARGDIAAWWAANLRRGRLLAPNAFGSSFVYSASTNKVYASWSHYVAKKDLASDAFNLSRSSKRVIRTGVHMTYFPYYDRDQSQYPEQSLFRLTDQADETGLLCSINAQQGAFRYTSIRQ